MEKEGLICRQILRRPQLTEKGRIQAQRYAERIATTTNHLFYEVVNMDSAQNDAYYWAIYNTGDTVEVTANSASAGKAMRRRIKNLKYFDNGNYTYAGINGDFYNTDINGKLFHWRKQQKYKYFMQKCTDEKMPVITGFLSVFTRKECLKPLSAVQG